MRALALGIIMAVGAAALPQKAEAFSFHDLGRFVGLGWSDGYHARVGCDAVACGRAVLVAPRISTGPDAPCHQRGRFIDTPSYVPPPTGQHAVPLEHARPLP